MCRDTVALAFRRHGKAAENVFDQSGQPLRQEADHQNEERAEYQEPGVEEGVTKIALRALDEKGTDDGPDQRQPTSYSRPDHYRQAECRVELRGRDILRENDPAASRTRGNESRDPVHRGLVTA